MHAVAEQGDESQRGPVEGQTHRAFVLSLVKRVIANVWYIASCESVFLSHTVHGRSVSTACLGQPFRERLLNALVGNVSSGSVTCNVQILCNANSMFALFHVGAGCVFDEGARENRALFHVYGCAEGAPIMNQHLLCCWHQSIAGSLARIAFYCGPIAMILCSRIVTIGPMRGRAVAGACCTLVWFRRSCVAPLLS